jgi:hypothetical protein
VLNVLRWQQLGATLARIRSCGRSRSPAASPPAEIMGYAVGDLKRVTLLGGNDPAIVLTT